MCNTILKKRTVKIVANMFSQKTFDITLLDKYFRCNNIETDLVFSLYNYIYKTEWANTFNFTDVFDIEFKKIADTFISLNSNSFTTHTSSYTIDVMNLQNPIKFKDTFIQNIFTKWLRWES